MGKSNQIIGVCRFSYPGKTDPNCTVTGFQTSPDVLFEPERMKRRFAYFEQICLPSLAAQTDKDFILVVLIGDTMPFHWRKRLKELQTKYPFLDLCVIEPTGPLNSTRRAYRRGYDEASDFVTGFRIDDDDAVAKDYIERTRETAQTLLNLGWVSEDRPAAICYHGGIYWDMNRPKDRRFFDFREAAPLGLASAMVTVPDARVNIFRWNHRRLSAYVRVWSDPFDRMFVRTLHGHNDSGRSIPPGAVRMSDGDAFPILRERFGLRPRHMVPRMAELQAQAAS